MDDSDRPPPQQRSAPLWLLQLGALGVVAWLVTVGPPAHIEDIPDLLWGILFVAIAGPEAVARFRSGK